MVPDVRSLLRPLVRPRAALAEDPPDATTGVVVVALAGLLVAGSLVAAGLAVGDVVDGTTTVPNPDKPPEWQCDEPVGDIPTPDGCDAPATVERPLGPAAQQRVVSAGLGAPFALGLLWLGVAGAGYLLGAGESFGATLGRAAWAFVPVGLLWPVRAAGMTMLADGREYGSSLSGVRESAAELALGNAEPALVAVSVVGFAWAGYVLVGGFAAGSGSRRRGLLAATPLAGFGLLAALGSPFHIASADGDAVPALILLLGLFGLPLLLVPRGYIEFHKRFELVGFRNTREVEPSDWYVALHRVGGLLVVVGAAVVVGAGTYLI
jgi:hypothetical protein